MSSTEVAERRPLTPLDIGATKAAQKLYQDGLAQLLEPGEDLTPIRGRGGKVKNHVNRSGVSKITTWVSVSTTLVDMQVTRDPEGKPQVWTVTVRAEAPDGRMADGVGAFDVTERPSKKPEHDGLGTAFTRARNRAVMDLIGMGEVSAEEMVAGSDNVDGERLPFGPEATVDRMTAAQEVIPRLIPGADGEATLKLLVNNFGYLPEIACRTIMGLYYVQTHPAPAAGGSSEAPSGAPNATRAPDPAQPTGEAVSPAQGPTASGPEFDEMVPPTTDDADDVDIDAILADDSK